jgi:hypothetical protein
MNWFKHDTDATTDAKIKKLLIRHGVTGYAIYFHCLELIAGDISETNITFQLEHDSEIIADNLRIKGTAEKSGIAIVEEIMRYILELGLFSEQDGRIFCYKLLKRIDLSMTGKSAMRELITEAKARHDAVMITHDPVMNRGVEWSGVEGSEKKKDKRAPKSPRASFQKPTFEEVAEYCKERENKINAQSFLDHYESNGWMVGKTKMKDWRAAVRTWERNDYGSGGKRGAPLKVFDRPGLDMEEK